MILKPQAVILDEPTSALDRSVQGQVIELLRDLQAKHGLSYVFISHDLSVVRAISDYVVVMKDGKIVEEGPTDAIFSAPQADYTKTLIGAAYNIGAVVQGDRWPKAACRISCSFRAAPRAARPTWRCCPSRCG
jgi:oligopeptide transport system ATP-binding protein